MIFKRHFNTAPDERRFLSDTLNHFVFSHMLVPACGLGGAVVTLPFTTQKKHWASLGPGNEIPVRMYSGTKAIFCD